MKKKIIALFSAMAMLLQFGAAIPVFAEETPISAVMSIYDDNGNILDSLNGVTNANAEIAISGTKSTASQVYLAVYGEGNKLLNVYIDENVATLPDTVEFDLALAGEDVQIAKAFVWDNLEPVVDKVEMKTIGIQGILSAGNMLSIKSNGFDEKNIVSYEWYQSSSEAGEYTTYSTEATCQSEFNETSNVDKWYKVKVTLDDGTSYTTAPVKVAAATMKCYSRDAKKWSPAGTRETSDADYTFEIGGQRFVLLDTIETSYKSHYMVMADQTYGIQEFPKEDTYKTNLAKIKALLPQAIQDGIKQNVFFEGSYNEWGTWFGSWLSDVHAPSGDEMDRYKDIVGMKVCNYKDTTGTPVTFTLRSRHNSFTIGLSWDNGTKVVHNLRNLSVWDDFEQGEIRPVFYLDKDFFTRNALIITNAGGVVQQEMGDLDGIKGIRSGEVQGIMSAGNMLSFAYEGVNVTDEDIVSYEWYQATSEAGEYTAYSTEATCQSEFNTTSNVDRWYKVKVTLDNETSYTTAPVKVAAATMKCYSREAKPWSPAGTRETSNADYTFEIGGQRFVLLDTVETSDKSHYMVMADQTYGIQEFPKEDTYKTNLAKIKALLPQAIQDGIKQNVFFEGSYNEWGTWFGSWLSDVHAPSGDEMDRYKDIVGMKVCNYKDTTGTPVTFTLRSRHNSFTIGLSWDNGTKVVHNLRNLSVWDDFEQGEIRPVFYLDKDFFTRNAGNILNAGTKVQELTGATDLSVASALIDGNAVRLLGRGEVQNIASRTFNWPNSGFEFSFNGTKAEVYVDNVKYDTADYNGNYFNVIVDGGEPERIKLEPGWNVLCTGLEKIEHTVKVVRSSEAYSGSILMSYIRTNGSKPSATEDKERFIEFVGDSYTAGFGNNIIDTDAPDHSSINTDNWNSYTGIVSRYFDADSDVIAYQGKGVYVNCGGDTYVTMSKQYNYADIFVNENGFSTQTEWDFERKPDVVMVWLGTNDSFGATALGQDLSEEFEQAYINLLTNIRSKNPDAKILCCALPTRYPKQVKNAVEEMGGNESGFFFYEINKFDGFGSLGHPDVVEHNAIAGQIINEIESICPEWKQESVHLSGRISGVLSAGNILSFENYGVNVADEDIVSYEWYQSSSEAGEYTTYSTEATCQSEFNETSNVDKWYKVKVTLDDGTSYTTAPVKVAAATMKCYSRDAKKWSPAGTRETSDADYTFEIGGQRFVLLDTIETSYKSHYMVMADQTYGIQEFPKEDTYKTNLAKIKALLPQAIQDGIKQNVFFEGSYNEWGTWFGSWLSDVHAPSGDEMDRYKDIVGMKVCNYKDTTGTPVTFTLRSRHNSFTIGLSWDNGTKVVHNLRNLSVWDDADQGEIRPVFYLDKDFFTRNALNITNAGGVVQEEIGELDEVKGILSAGNMLSVKSNKFDEEDIASYEWYQSSSEAGEYTTYSTEATCQSEFNETSNVDKWYKVKVTLDDGTSYTTAPVKVAAATMKCYSRDAKKWSPAGTRETSDADYTFEIGGQRFVLLDTIETSYKSHYMVMADQTYGIQEFPKEDTYKTNLAKIKALLPQAIQDGIKQNVFFEGSYNEWGTWFGSWLSDVHAPSGDEMDRYKDIVGMKVCNYKDTTGTPVTFTLRSRHNSFTIGLSWDNGTKVVHNLRNLSVWDDADQGEIRPVFYLDKDFFTRNEGSFTYLGNKVAEKANISGLTAALLSVSMDVSYLGENMAKHRNNLYLSDGNIEYRVTICSATDNEESFVIEASCGSKAYDPIEVNVPAGETYTGVYTMDDVLQGKQDISINVKKKDGTVIGNWSAETSVMHPKKEGYLEKYTRKVGISGSMSPYTTQWSWFNNLTGRTEKTWSSVETEKGVYAVDDKHLEDMLVYEETGADRSMLLNYNNKLYSSGNNVGPSTKENFDAFANYGKHMVNTYTAYDWFEVWNEPDGSWAWEDENVVDYTYLAEITKNEIVKENADAKTLIGVELSNGSFVRGTFDNGLWPNMDMAVHHPYMDPNKVDTNYNNKLSGMTSAIVDAGGWKEQIITEVGWSTYTGGGATEEQAAIELAKQIFVADYHGIMTNMMYMGADQFWGGYDETHREHNFGVILDHELKIKPSAYTVKTAADMTAGSIFFGKIPYSNDNIEAYAYLADGEITVVMWANAAGNESTIDVTFEGETLNGFDMIGNPIEGTNAFTVSEAPIYLKGFTKEWLLDSIAGITQDYLNWHLEKSFADCKSNTGWDKAVTIMNKSVAIAEGLSKTAYPTEDVAFSYLDKNYKICEELITEYKNGKIDISLGQLTGLLYVNNWISNMWTAVCMLSVDGDAMAPTANTAISAVEIKMNTKRGEQTMSHTKAILDWAKKYYDKASGVYALEGTNPMKAGVVKAWDAYAFHVASIADMIADVEGPSHDNILIQLPSSECKLERLAKNTIYASVYNYRNTAALTGKVQLVDPSGNIIDTSDTITINAGESTKVELTISLGWLLNSGDYKLQFIENGNVIVERKAYLIV